MSKHIPEYLRLHTEEGESGGVPRVPRAAVPTLPTALTQAVGWHVDWTSTSGPGAERLELGARVAASGDEQPPNCPQAVAAHLVQTINGLLDQLGAAFTALGQREAELAAGVPVRPRADESVHLAQRLEAILRGGAEAVGCQAAGLYLLDAGTSHLKLRAAWGLPSHKLTEPARPLRGAVADLEALIGHAVVLEDAQLLSHWKPPEDFAAAVCIPVSTPTSPLGTMWIFCRDKRDFRDQETQMLEIVAGRLASELEREMLLNEAVQTRHWDQQLARVSSRQQQRLPSFPPLLEQWDFAAWSAPANDLAAEFYDWGVACDGRPYVAVGHAEGLPLEAAVSAAALQSALKSHLVHCRDPRSVLEAINETFWCGSAGDQFASLFFALLEPEKRELVYSFAGRTTAFIVGPRGTRPLSHSSTLLGLGPDARFPAQAARLQRDETLVLGGTSLLRGREGSGGVSIESLGDRLRQLPPGTSAADMLEQLRVLLLSRQADGPLPEFTLLLARGKD